MAPAKTIQPWQRSRIFGLARELGMSASSNDKSDDLHMLIASRTGKDSLKVLTAAEADSLLGELGHRRRFGGPPAPDSRFVFTERPGGLSEGQYRKVIALMCELRKLDEARSPATIEQRVAGIVRQYLHLSSSEKDPYAWLSYKDGNRLIECLKGMLNSAKKKAARGSGDG